MKKIALLLALVLATAVPATAKTEPLLLEPLSPAVLSGTQYKSVAKSPQVTVAKRTGAYEATYTPRLGENMIPQNAVAEGKPAPIKKKPRVKIQTKQRSQGNAYWNPGGKGTKAYF